MQLRRILIALVVVAIAVVLSWREGVMQNTSHTVDDASARRAAAQIADSPSGSVSTETALADASRPGSVAAATAAEPLRLELHAPAEVRAGDVFDAQVDVDAGRGFRELSFALTWDKKRLSLVAATAGTFTAQGALPAAFAADEPSDGNAQFSVRAASLSSLAGRGTLVNLRFEALRAGTSDVILRNVNVVDAMGAAHVVDVAADGKSSATPDVVLLRSGAITSR